MRSLIFSLALSFGIACAPAHLKSVGLSGEREVAELFLGGWDGKRLRVFDDSVIEPGLTTRDELVKSLKSLSSDRYTAIWVEGAKLDAPLRERGAFCETSLCALVFSRRGAQPGPLVAVFELTGSDNTLVGSAWIAGDSIRPPGPGRWPNRCISATGTPMFVHPDGGAIFPERKGAGGSSYAMFNREKVPEAYRQPAQFVGFPAPHPNFCDDEQARLSEQPEPEKPVINVDPSLLSPN